MDEVKLTVTVDDDHIASTETLASTLQSHGFHVDRLIPEAGAIFGTATREVATQLRSVDGVQDVRPTRGYQLPEFSSNIPQ
jgi:hypothetical protein